MTCLLLSGICLLSPGQALASAWGNVPLGTKIPALSLRSTTGTLVPIKPGQSSVLVLLYLRTRHVRSSRALKDLIELYELYRSKGMRALAVSASTQAEVKRLNAPFPVLLDPQQAFYGKFGVFVHPSTGVVDRDGVLRYEYSSHRPDYKITVEQQIKAVLGLGPPVEEIKDADRQATSPETLREQRTQRMAELRRRIESKRARSRLLAARSLLGEQSIGYVLDRYRAWAATLPPSTNPRLAALAARVSSNRDLQATAAALRRLARHPGLGPEAQLWLGRAQAALKQLPEARQTLARCSAGKGWVPGACSFELAATYLNDDNARAVQRCKRGFQAIFDTTTSDH